MLQIMSAAIATQVALTNKLTDATTATTKGLKTLEVATTATNIQFNDLAATPLAQVKAAAKAHVITAVDGRVDAIIDWDVSTHFKDRMDEQI